ncbi:MAG: hypothetical protein OXG13_12950 [Gemmatimonadaceae bacterium]|nr:hypothetical protein [Gemmatimonadaceae bacterium]
MRLSGPVEKPGFFWLPQDQENQVPGILRISKSGEATLEISYSYNPVLSLLSEPPLGHSPVGSPIDRICGIAGNSRLTLDRCFRVSGSQVSGDGVSTSTIRAEYAFLGVNFEEGEIVTFSSVQFSVEGLDEWLRISGFHTSEDWAEKRTAIDFTLPDEINHHLPDGFDLKLSFSATLPAITAAMEARIVQKAHITLIPGDLRPLDDFLTLVLRLHNFLRLAIDKPISVDSVTGYSKEKTGSLAEGKTYQIPIKLFFQGPPYAEEKPETLWFRMLFSRRDVADQLEGMLCTWLKNYTVHESAFNLYFASISGASTYLESKFLSLVQGIEVLHRRAFPGTQMGKDEFAELLDMAVCAIPPDRREWLQDRLKYANELPLRRRIKQMVDPFKHSFGEARKRKSFVSKVTDTRNYLTHYDRALASRAVEGKDLWNLCLKLEALFQMHLLRLMGMGIDSIRSIANENQALRFKLGMEDSEPSERSG